MKLSQAKAVVGVRVLIGIWTVLFVLPFSPPGECRADGGSFPVGLKSRDGLVLVWSRPTTSVTCEVPGIDIQTARQDGILYVVASHMSIGISTEPPPSCLTAALEPGAKPDALATCLAGTGRPHRLVSAPSGLRGVAWAERVPADPVELVPDPGRVVQVLTMAIPAGGEVLLVQGFITGRDDSEAFAELFSSILASVRESRGPVDLERLRVRLKGE